MTLQRLRDLVNPEFNAVNALISAKTQSNITTIDDLASYIIQSGGKRIRPLVVLLACKACNYEGDDNIKLAALIELFHTATLLHDDVIDESSLRRGKQTANQIWGSKATILVGDFLYVQYMQLLIDIASLPIMQVLNNMAYAVSCSEIQQLSNQHNPDLAMEKYFDVIRGKTSLFFASATQSAGLLSNAQPEIVTSLYNFGLHLGNAFQLIDDALDFCADPDIMGKNIGDDLAEGKPTLPLLYVLQEGTPNQQQLVKQSIEQGGLTSLPDIMTAIEQTKALDYTKKMAQLEADKAILALQILPDSVYKHALYDVALYAVQRDH